MIKFFRRIRHTLLLEGKTGKYLKYAVGEIILVVIGILIALQINNWNELKNEQKVEKVYMTNLVEDLKSDLLIYSSYGQTNKTIYNLIDSIIPNLKSPDRSIHTSKLSFWARMITAKWQIIHPVQRTFEQMKSSGHLRLVRNKKVADGISQYYNSLSEFDGYNEAGMIWASDYAKAMGKVFDAEVLLNIIKERKAQNTNPSTLLTEDPIVLNELINSLQYFYGALSLGESVSIKKSANAKSLIELIENGYQ